MTQEERIITIQTKIGNEYDSDFIATYLRSAIKKILARRFPFGTNLIDVEPIYEEELIELTIVLINQQGGEGQELHSENGITRRWRSEAEILQNITPVADCFL